MKDAGQYAPHDSICINFTHTYWYNIIYFLIKGYIDLLTMIVLGRGDQYDQGIILRGKQGENIFNFLSFYHVHGFV